MQQLAADVEQSLLSLSSLQADALRFDVGLLLYLTAAHTRQKQTRKATEQVRSSAAERWALYDAAILLAADGLPLQPTRKFAESLLGDVWLSLAETNLPDKYKTPSHQTVIRRIIAINQTDAMDKI